MGRPTLFASAKLEQFDATRVDRFSCAAGSSLRPPTHPMAKRGAAEGRRIDWVAALAPRSPRSADSFSVSSPAHPMRKRGGGARVEIDWCSMFRTGTPELPEAEPSSPPAAAVVPRSAGVGNDEQVRERMPAGGSRKKARKGAKKPKKSEDAMVRAMEMCVQMRKKQVEDQAALLAKESAESRNFSISRCIHVLHKMEGIRRDERPRAYNVFRNAENREIFLASAAVDEDTVILWLRSEMAELARGT